MMNEARTKLTPIYSLLLFFFALQLCFGFLVVDGNTLSFDEAIWHYIGRNWLRYGLVPFSGGVDNKSPIIFLVSGISDALFGINYWMPRLLGAIAQTIGIYFLFRLVAKKFDYHTALIATSLYGLALTWKCTGGKYISFGASYEIPFTIAAFYYFLRDERNKSIFLSGLLSGIGIFIRLTGIFGAAAILFTAIKRGGRSVLVLLGGMLCSALLFLLFIILSKISLKEVFIYGFSDNFGSGSITSQSIFWKLDNLVNGVFHTELILFLPGVIGYLFIRRKADIFVLWLILSFIGINIIGLYARAHFRELLPSLSILTAVTIVHVMNTQKIKFKYVIIATWICFFPKELEPLLAFKNLIVKPKQQKLFCATEMHSIDDEDKKRLGIWVKENTKDSDFVYVAGMSAIVQAYSERISPTIYFNLVQTKTGIKRLVQDLSAHPPGYILIPQTGDYMMVTDSVRNFIAHLAEKNYTYQGCQFSYSIYKRKF